MIDLHATTGSQKVGTKVFCDSDTAVAATGATDSDRQAGLALFTIAWNQE